MRVTRLPCDPGPAAWNRLLPDPEPATPLEGKTTADWLIIGAGYAGLAAAYRLSQLRPEARVIILDATRVADGPAGRNSGFMIDLPHDLSSENYRGDLSGDIAQTADNRRGIALAAELAARFDLPDEAFAQSGKINGAATARGDRHNQDFARHLQAMNEEFEWLDARQMHDITGSHYYQSGLFTPGAAMIQPALFVRHVAEGVRSNRVTLHENSPVTDLTRNGDWQASTPTGQVRVPNVILAVNGHLQSFGHLPGRLMHVFTYASMTRALTQGESTLLGGAPVWGLTPADPMGSTMRRINGIGGDRLLIRNRFTFDPSMEVDDQRLRRICADHDRALAARFPHLSGIEMAYRWGGRLCLSLNNVQVIGALDEGLWSACCQNGLGTAKGLLAGTLAVEDALGVDSPALTRARSADLPQKLPPAPMAKIGADLRLSWSRFRAGREV